MNKRDIRRGDVILVPLDPGVGSEVGKTRPCLVVSPEELNRHAPTIVIVPLTTSYRAYPWRVTSQLQNEPGQVMLDQIRTISKDHIVKWVEAAPVSLTHRVLDRLQEMFAI